MQVEVRPIDFDKWHGKKGKDSFTQPKAIEALYDPETGRYATGLTPEETNEYSKRLGVSLDDTFNPSEPHPFYSQKAAWVMLQNNTMIFNTDRDMDFVKVKLMKASKKVANSMKEYNEGKWPEATHFIHDESEEVHAKAGKAELKRKAYQILGKLTQEDQIAVIQCLSKKSLKGRSADFITVEIESLIENDPAEFVRLAEMGREEVTLRANVLELMDKQVLTKEGTAILYMGETIGYTYEEAIHWFKNPNNQKMKIAILEKLIKR
jgi:hypothetical protein